LNLKQLETFLTIARLGSFRAAAERLNSTQSTISARIQELEEALGVQLFDRSTRRPYLTTKGRELIAYAEKAVELIADIRLKIGAAQEFSGVVRMGLPEIVAVTWLPELVARVRERYPKLVLQLEVGLNPDLISRLSGVNRTLPLLLEQAKDCHSRASISEASSSRGWQARRWTYRRKYGLPKTWHKCP
jgi:DNA-binding transcriptional LysR family regulator